VALSASLRAELLREIECLGPADDAALWAQRRIPAKNQLSATDAQQVEEAFAAKLAVMPVPAETTGTAQIDKTMLVFPEPRAISCARSQGERRIYGADMSRASP
jgi:hypothetical protein